MRLYIASRSCADRESKEDRAILEEMSHSVVEDLADGRVVPAHHSLHAVDGADHVRLVDHVAAADSDEEVL